MNPTPNTSSQNRGGDSPPELVPSHPLGFLLPRAPNPNAAPPVLYSFFPLSPSDMDPTTFAPSQTVNPRSSRLFLPSQEASQPADNPPVLRKQCTTTNSVIEHHALEELATLIEKTKKAEAARISHPELQIRDPLLKSPSKPPNQEHYENQRHPLSVNPSPLNPQPAKPMTSKQFLLL